MAIYKSTNNYMYFTDYSDGILKLRVTYDLEEDPIANTYSITITQLNLAGNGLTGKRWHNSKGYFTINGQTISRTAGIIIFAVADSNLGYNDSNNISASSMYSPVKVGPFSYDSYPQISAKLVDYYFRWVPNYGESGSSGNPHSGTVSGTTSNGGTLTAPHAHTHNYSSSITTPATCTSTGIKTYTCGCGKSYTETIAALGHNYQFSKTVAPTCTTQGYDIYVCKNDTSHTEKRNYTDMIGHSYGIVVVQPTCTKQGYTDHICKNCGHIYTDTYVEPLGHSWGEWEVTVEPQYQKEGEASRFCPVCQTTEKKILAALQEALRRALIKIQNNNFIANIAMKDEEGKIIWFKFLPRIGN